MEKLTDHQKIQNIAAALHITPQKLFYSIGYKSPATMDRIKKGTGRITPAIQARLLMRYPNISNLYLLHGRGNPLDSAEDQEKSNKAVVVKEDGKQDVPNYEMLAYLQNVEKQVASLQGDIKKVLLSQEVILQILKTKI